MQSINAVRYISAAGFADYPSQNADFRRNTIMFFLVL